MAEPIPRRLKECIAGIGCNLSFEEINELYERHSNVIDRLPDELLLQLLENMDYLSAGRFCSSSPRIEEICRNYDVESWFRIEEKNRTIRSYLIKEPLNDPSRKKLLHSWNDKPAVIYPDGTEFWYKEGNLHRDGDKPAIIWSDSTKEWYKEGKHHRDDDKPAVIHWNNTKMWYKEGKLHRGGGKPAVTGPEKREWWREGIQYGA